MSTEDTTTPVVALKAVAHGALGIVRSLGRLGVRVYVVDSDPRAPAFSSRYCRGKFVYDIDKVPPEKLLTFMLDVGRRIGQRSILIPTNDDVAMFVADHADALKPWFIFAEQSSDLVHSLSSKKEMYCLAKKFGLPTAEAVFPQSRADVLNFLKAAVFPIMLKGVDGERLWRRTRKKMFIVRSQSELLEKYDSMEEPENPNLMLQEYIPGGDDTVWMFNGYFNEHSECLLGFTGKKIRQCPVYTGATSLGICQRNEIVEKTTKEFMKKIGYKGILDIGYRFDARDGVYKVLDINPRIGSTFRLFVAENGMDVARALYLDLTGQAVIPGLVPEGRKWIVEDLDLVSCFRYHRDGKLTVREWLRSFRGIQEAAYLAPDDLLPIVPMCVGRVGEGLRRIYNEGHRRLAGDFRDGLADRGVRSPSHLNEAWPSKSLQGRDTES